MWKIALKFISQRLVEPSTWLGFIAALSAYGFHPSDNLRDSIVKFGIAFGGVVLVFLKEKKD